MADWLMLTLARWCAAAGEWLAHRVRRRRKGRDQTSRGR